MKKDSQSPVPAHRLVNELLRRRKPGDTWEDTVRRLNRRDQFRKLLIGLVATGALTLSGGRLSARQVSQLWGECARWLLGQPEYRRRIRRALARYARERTVVFTEDAGSTIIQLTADGKRVLERYNWEDLTIERPAKWDGRWRVVLFDIPEEQRLARDVLRAKLQELGFVFVQKSAWVHPFPCEHIIAAYRELYEVGRYVTTLVADSIDGEDRLRRKFGI